MADPRETARAWLAERLDVAYTELCSCSTWVCSECGGRPCEPHVLDAILSADGVEVGNQLLIVNDLWRQDTDDPAYATHTQVVIRLPAQPIGKTT